MWQWSLNWDEVSPQIVVGSCPMQVEDLVSIRRHAQVTAALSLQHDECLSQFGIDYPTLLRHGAAAGLRMERCPMRDFDPPDMQRVLPRALATLAGLLRQGHRVYLHCTAGMGRSPLTAVGYFMLVEGEPLDAAAKRVLTARRCAAPNWDALHGCRRELVAAHRDRIAQRAYELYRQQVNSDPESDWRRAETSVLREVLLAEAERPAPGFRPI